MAGFLLLGVPGFDESKRSSINVDGPNKFSYAFIDHTKQADSWLQPTGSGWTTFNLTQSCDANGWVNKDTSGGTSNPNTEALGGQFRIPSCTDFNGAYVMDWTGNATVALNDTGIGLTWTQDNSTSLGNTSGTYTRSVNSWTNQAGQNAIVVIKPSGTTGPALLSISITSTGPTPFLTNLRFYRFEDRADLLAGNIFRAGWKTRYINLNPHHVRTLDWSGANDSNVVRFASRNIPGGASYFKNASGTGQPHYSVTAMATSCQYTLDPGGVSGMPVTYQQGEQVTCRIGQTDTNDGYPICYISAISTLADAVVTVDLTQGGMTNNATFSWAGGTATATFNHAYTVGSTIQILVAGTSPSGYNQANATATVASSSTLTYAIANPGGTSSIGTVASHGRPNGENLVLIMSSTTNNSIPTGMTQIDRKVAVVASATPNTFNTGINAVGFFPFTTGFAVNNMTLNVGARGIKPVYRQDGNSPALKYAGGFFRQGTYCTFTYDSNLIGNTGVTGAWLVNQQADVLNPGVPPEIVTALCNELMAMNPRNTINLYITLPTLGLCSLDNDYTTAAAYAINFIDIIINPASVQRASGFTSLDSRCTLYVEHSNETWNQGNYVACLYQAWRGFQQFGTTASDLSSYSSIRAAQTVLDVKAAFPPASWPKIKYVLGLQSTFGGANGTNTIRFNGGTNYNSVIPGGHSPLFEFDLAAFAGYFANDDSTPANSLATNLAAWIAAAGNPVAQEAAYLAYCTGFKTSAGGAETIDNYVTTKLGGGSGAAVACIAQGKTVIGYEGGFQPTFVFTFTDNTGAFTNGSTSVTLIGNNVTYTSGYYVIGTGIPALTTLSAPAAGSFTLSNAFTGTTGRSYFIVLAPSAYFISLARGSASWKVIHRTWFDRAANTAGSIAPAEFIVANDGSLNWYHTFGQDSYLSGNEQAGLDLDFIEQGNRNRGG